MSTPKHKPEPKSLIRALGIPLLLLAVFAFFVWPTPYRTWKGSNSIHYRRNRFTRQVEYEIGGGWYDVRDDPSVIPASKQP